MTETKQTNTAWIDEELKQMNSGTDYEKQPTLKLEENQIADIVIDASKPFQSWTQKEDNGTTTIKAIIPVTKAGVKLNWWLNKKNPIYGEVMRTLKTGTTSFKVLRTGQQKNTKYVLVK